MNDVTWLPAPGIEGYEVSSDGRVRSVDGTSSYMWRGQRVTRSFSGQVLRTPLNPDGYQTVTIRKQWFTVHSLVARAFHGPRPDGQQVRHLNGVRTDNRIENLRWGTPKENTADMLRHGTNREASKTHCKRGHPFDEENTYRTAKGRECKQCHRDLNRIWMRTYKQPKRRSA